MKWLICIGILFLVGGLLSIKDNFVVFVFATAVGIIFICSGRNKKNVHKKCIKCGKGKMVSYIDEEGYCCDCARTRDLARIAQAKRDEDARIAQAKREEEEHIAQAKRKDAEECIARSERILEERRLEREAFLSALKKRQEEENEFAKDPLNTISHHGLVVKGIYQGLPAVYWYPNTHVSNVDRDMLRKIADTGNFVVELSLSEDKKIYVMKDGAIVGCVEEKQNILKDWISRGLPMVCEFTAFRQGKEAVSIALYRDDEKRLSDKQFVVTKLTSCMSEDKQEIIWFLEKGQKLFLEVDDNDKPYIRDIQNNAIGNLPSKYKDAYFEDAIAGVFFDHSEKSENANGDEKDIPYVKIYFY